MAFMDGLRTHWMAFATLYYRNDSFRVLFAHFARWKRLRLTHCVYVIGLRGITLSTELNVVLTQQAMVNDCPRNLKYIYIYIYT